ncbi:MAG: lipid-A-disaccharide synthase [Pseudorhodoplanes sp.]
MTQKQPTLFIVAGEESGDRLGAALIRALKARCGDDRLHFAGVGGHAMAEEGIRNLFPIDELAIVGLAAIPKRLPAILRRIRETAAAAIAAQPDALVIIDSPDFTHRVARRVRARAPHIPIVDYVSPSVWAWRPGRAKAMRRYVDRVLALLPFEPEAHRRLGGPPCIYVGHPLSEQAASLRPNSQERARRDANPPVLLVFPGSRNGELRRMLPDFAETVGRLRAQLGAIDVVMPTTPHLESRLREMIASWPQPPRVIVDAEEKRAAFRIARAALAKSGTVTLELAVSGIPMVAAYKISSIEAAIARRVIKVPSVILANLVLGENVVPEFLQEDCTPQKLTAALLPLFGDGPERARQLRAFARLDAIMQIGEAEPARRAAEIVLETAGIACAEGAFPSATQN